MKESDVIIPEETTEVKLSMRIAELEAELATKTFTEKEFKRGYNAGLEVAENKILEIGGAGYEYMAAYIRALKEETT